MNTFDRNLQRLRKLRNMKQEDLAQRMNVSRQTVSGWETGRRQPDLDTLKKLAGKVGYTENYLARKFKAEMGMPINAYVRKARIHRAKMLLSATAMSIQEIADQLHFCSGSYFAEAFQKEAGESPTAYREKNKQ